MTQALALINSGCVGGGAIPCFDGRVPFWATVMIETLIVPYRLARLAAGAFIFCTGEVFERSRGLDEALLGGEEVNFARAALKRVGRFALIKDHVVTSGRKLRAHSFGEIMGVLCRTGLKGRRGVSSRNGLEMWYGPRRVDPRDQVEKEVDADTDAKRLVQR